MKFLSIVVVALLSIDSHAFAPVISAGTSASTNVRTAMNTRVRMSSAEKEKTDTEKASSASDDGYDLLPEFRAAYDKTEQALSAVIPQKDLLNPLLHFGKEYLAASQASLENGNEDCTAQKASGRIMEAIQLGMEYGTGENKYMFGSAHLSMRGDPEKEDGNEVDFYKFGCE